VIPLDKPSFEKFEELHKAICAYNMLNEGLHQEPSYHSELTKSHMSDHIHPENNPDRTSGNPNCTSSSAFIKDFNEVRTAFYSFLMVDARH